MVALVFVAFVTPYEVGLLDDTHQGSMILLFVMNRCVDLLFMLDIVVQFFVPYRNREGMWVMDNRMMAVRYLTSTRPARCFVLDLASSFPFDLFLLGLDSQQSTALRIVKMLRIIKLVRMLRVSRIFKRWEAQIGMTHATMKMIEFLMISLVMAHWMACLWTFVGRLGDYSTVLENDPEWAAIYPGVPYTYPGPRGPGYAYRHHSWIQKAGMYDAQPWELYGAALYLALTNMFGGSGEPSPANYYEFYAQSLMMLVGSSVWAYIIGAGCECRKLDLVPLPPATGPIPNARSRTMPPCCCDTPPACARSNRELNALRYSSAQAVLYRRWIRRVSNSAVRWTSSTTL